MLPKFGNIFTEFGRNYVYRNSVENYRNRAGSGRCSKSTPRISRHGLQRKTSSHQTSLRIVLDAVARNFFLIKESASRRSNDGADGSPTQLWITYRRCRRYVFGREAPEHPKVIVSPPSHGKRDGIYNHDGLPRLVLI